MGVLGFKIINSPWIQFVLFSKLLVIKEYILLTTPFITNEKIKLMFYFAPIDKINLQSL